MKRKENNTTCIYYHLFHMILETCTYTQYNKRWKFQNAPSFKTEQESRKLRQNNPRKQGS